MPYRTPAPMPPQTSAPAKVERPIEPGDVVRVSRLRPHRAASLAFAPYAGRLGHVDWIAGDVAAVSFVDGGAFALLFVDEIVTFRGR